MQRYYPYQYDLVMYISKGQFKITNKVKDPFYDCTIYWPLLLGELSLTTSLEALEEFRKVGKLCVRILKIQKRMRDVTKSKSEENEKTVLRI